MQQFYGYHGAYLRIDLTRRVAEIVPLRESVLRRYIGGVGLGTWLLLQEGLDGVDPYDPRMPVAFVFSPLVGTTLTTSAKFAVVAKSPLTHRLSDSLSSSYFAIAGKRVGVDAIVIVGASDDPVALKISGGLQDGNGTTPGTDACRQEGRIRVDFEAARRWWGLSSRQTSESIRHTWGKEYRVASIGQAGENLVRYATVSSDGRHAGRGGVGAVLGSKQLKAIAVCGQQTVESAWPAQLIELSRDLSQRSLGPATEKYRELGTVSNLMTFNRMGTLPTRNFQSGHFEGASHLDPESFVARHPRTRESCAACTIGCEHLFHGLGGRDESGVRLEYESLFALGPLCGIGSPEVVLQATAICDEIGIDTISAGATIALTMECVERGWLVGQPLRFGDEQGLLTVLREIGARTGLGDRLAEGSRRLARSIGPEAEAIAPHVKGLEIPGYEPRALQAMALGFAVGTRGADHNRSGAYQVDFSDKVDRMRLQVGEVKHAIATEDESAVIDSLILCKFLRGALVNRYAEMATMISLVTGWDIDAQELSTVARRIVAARKWYNVRHGWTPAEDTLPRRFLTEPLEGGASAGASLTESGLRSLIAAYYAQRGWNSDGSLPSEHLDELQIETD